MCDEDSRNVMISCFSSVSVSDIQKYPETRRQQKFLQSSVWRSGTSCKHLPQFGLFCFFPFPVLTRCVCLSGAYCWLVWVLRCCNLILRGWNKALQRIQTCSQDDRHDAVPGEHAVVTVDGAAIFNISQALSVRQKRESLWANGPHARWLTDGKLEQYAGIPLKINH